MSHTFSSVKRDSKRRRKGFPGGSRKVYHTYTMEYGGTTICVRRKKVKYLYLRVKKDGQVILTAPLGIPEDVICRFAQDKLPWISHQQNQWKLMQESIQPHTYETGDQFMLWGEPYTLVLEEGKKQFRLENGKIYLTVPSESTWEKRRPVLKRSVSPVVVGAFDTQVAVLAGANGVVS